MPTIREFLSDRKRYLQTEILKHQLSLEEIENLIKLLPSERAAANTNTTAEIRKVARRRTTGVPKRRKKGSKRRVPTSYEPLNRGTGETSTLWKELVKAGEAGLTAEEAKPVMEQAGFVVTRSLSSVLGRLKAQGRAKYVAPRYFANVR